MPCTSYRRRVIRNISPSRAASEIHTISNSKRRRSETKTRSVTFANDTFKSSASSASVHRRKNRTLRSSKRRTSSQRSRSVSSSRSQRSSRSRSKRKERVKKTRSTMSDGSEKSKSRSNRGLVKRRRSRRQALTGELVMRCFLRVKTKARKPRRRDSKGRFV
ncbi:hypothetical protein DICVIV_10298 [Dictyocaulus viviparus]|uniref:Uncharacterized protein n=1 Tax=Dictyocaulus viviparus TaxID=29172 RepID=A0A0D8XIT7_DICVI|nr:hypothetical protein DICVIV_10298 [Dictyocaulus viviparus]